MSYIPDISLDIAATDITLANDNLHWLYAVLTVVTDPETEEETRTATVEASEAHIDPLQYWESDGKIYYKLGYVGPVTNGEREAHLLWGNEKKHKPVSIAEGSTDFASISDNQVLTINPVNIASGITYYLHEEIDAGTGYESALTTPADDVEDSDVITINSTEGEKLLDTYITEAGNPGTTVIPSGAWRFTTYAKIGTVVGVTDIVIRVYKMDVAEVETELFNTLFTVDSTTTKRFDHISVQQEFNLAATDRIVFKYFVKTTSAANRTVTIYYEGTEHYSHIDTPIVALSAIKNHNDLLNIQGGTATERYHLTAAEKTAVENLPASFLEIGDWTEDIAFEFCDVVAGTAKDYTLDIKASFAYNILSACLETDNGTLTGVAVKIGSTAVTGLTSVTVDTAVDETNATAANSVATGDRVTLSVGTGYTGTPTLIRGKLKIQRT